MRNYKHIVLHIALLIFAAFGCGGAPASQPQFTVSQTSGAEELHLTAQPKPNSSAAQNRLEFSPAEGVVVHVENDVVAAVEVVGAERKRLKQWKALAGSHYVVGDLHATDVTPLLWRNLHLDITRPNGLKAYIETIRPLWWFSQTGVDEEGAQFEIEVVEAGIEGVAQVVHLDDQVTVDSRDVSPNSALVISTIEHEGAHALNLYFGDANSFPLGVTPPHPIFSATRNKYVHAGELILGEKVKTKNGVIELVKINQRSKALTVHNLEVHREQHYFVGPDKVKAHNTPWDCDTTEAALRKSRYRTGRREGAIPWGWPPRKHTSPATSPAAPRPPPIPTVDEVMALVPDVKFTKVGDFSLEGKSVRDVFDRGVWGSEGTMAYILYDSASGVALKSGSAYASKVEATRISKYMTTQRQTWNRKLRLRLFAFEGTGRASKKTFVEAKIRGELKRRGHPLGWDHEGIKGAGPGVPGIRNATMRANGEAWDMKTERIVPGGANINLFDR